VQGGHKSVNYVRGVKSGRYEGEAVQLVGTVTLLECRKGGKGGRNGPPVEVKKFRAGKQH